MISFYPLEDRPTSQAAAIYYRDRAKTWPRRCRTAPRAFHEIADGYEKIAIEYERREQLEGSKQVAVSEGV